MRETLRASGRGVAGGGEEKRRREEDMEVCGIEVKGICKRW